MSTLSTPSYSSLLEEQAVAQVWDRQWRHQKSDAQDDALLAREASGRRWRLIHDRLQSTFGTIRGLRTIELGSGRGDLSLLLAREGAEVTLLDSSRRALDQARRRFARLRVSAQFEEGDLFGGSAGGRGFHVALSSGVIEHFAGSDRTRSIAAHREVLGEGGLGIISVPHARCPSYRLWKAYLELRGWWPYGFEAPYARGELRGRAQQAGFARVEVRGAGFWQSVGDHLWRAISRAPVEWAAWDSRLDDQLGLSLVLFAWK